VSTEELRRLWADWNSAYATYQTADEDYVYEAERVAWDALVDYVEADDLNGTEWDPRGAVIRS
jgi:hypothetical protein